MRNDLRIPEGLTREFLSYHGVCPLRWGASGELVVGVTADHKPTGVEDLTTVYETSRIVTEVLTEVEFHRSVDRLVSKSEMALEGVGTHNAETALETDYRNLANQPPVVRYVNLLIREAYDARASDVHLESEPNGVSVRLRIDGLLVNTNPPAAELAQSVLSRIKLLAELDIAERRRPQDGRLTVRLDGDEFDVRVSSVPNMYGESVVLRLLRRSGVVGQLDELGMPARVLSDLRAAAKRPYGLVLVTGPTGSGKTTTLYACLQARSSQHEKTITIEDPVEALLPGVTQVPVQRQAGVTFASALRAILRQDPDVLMIGEMRDAETAEIAVQAAMTGHLVFATLHTNSAVAAVARLMDLGVPRYMINATLEAVVAQRLVRRVCNDCRLEDEQPYDYATELTRVLGAPVHGISRGGGCSKCHGTGYLGRTGLFEILTVTPEFREAVGHRSGVHALVATAERLGMPTMRNDAYVKLTAGITSGEEVLRALT